MRHEAGIERLSGPIPAESIMTPNIKQNKFGEIAEKDRQYIVPGYKRAYHSETRDSMANEWFRRIEPSNRTMDEYLRQEIKEQFGLQGLFIAMTPEEMKQSRTQFTFPGMGRMMSDIFCKGSNVRPNLGFSELMQEKTPDIVA